ncbi:TonB-dependent receptor [Bacteroidales bacterium OttesenSCG-928-I14]|nr:TonB-dependent receptor [Bacteroidales bacterium OttesenSCG-928-I14]
MRVCICILLSILSIFSLAANEPANKLKAVVKNTEGSPIIGAYIYWDGESKAVLSDKEGAFTIDLPKKEDSKLHIDYIGYESLLVEINDFNIIHEFILKENTLLEEVVVETKIRGRLKDRSDVFQIETLSTRELSRAACCNLSESFETNPSVDVSYSDAVTGAKQIQLLGLSGTYVQMLTENYPNFRGVSSIYGMDYIPGPWMQSIQVSKGAASVKNGYESTTGQINVEYKKPQQADPLSVNVFASDAGRYEANADGAIKLNENLYTGLLLHYSTENSEHDKNKDTFLDMPKKQQFNIMNRWHYQKPNFISQSGIKFVNDERTSGQTKKTLGESSLNPYEINLRTNRAEIFTKNGFILNNERNESIAVILSGTYHDQKSLYSINQYDVAQTNIYASLMYESDFGKKHKLSTGISLNYDNYDQAGNVADEFRNRQAEEETTSGAYIQYSFQPNEKLTLLAGVRADYSNLHSWFLTPRLHAKYNVADWLHLRLSAGKGYRSSFVLSENSYFLASNRKLIISSDLKQESAWNFGASASFYIPINKKELSLTAEWYYTRFDNQIVIDMDSNPHEVSFYNLDGLSDSQVLQVEATYSPIRGLTLLGAYRWMNPQTNYKGRVMTKPLVSKYKALATASYETRLKKWQFDFTAQFNGGGRMPLPDQTNPLWDGEFPAYTILNAQITKYFRTWSVYIGGENLTNFKQSHPIIEAGNPEGSNFDATMVWGPTMGRKFYIGFRYNIDK